MNEAQGAAATGESEGTQQPQPQTGSGLLAGSLREAVMSELQLPAEVLEAVGQAPAQGEPGQEQEQQPQEQPQEEVPGPEIPQIPEQQQPEEEQPEPVAASEDWPVSAKQRVAEEAEKRRARTVERDAWKTRAQELELLARQLSGQLQQAGNPPTRDDPLANVMDPQTLAHTVQVNEELEAWCDRNPDGAVNVLVGRDPQGNEIRKDYSREEIADMKVFAKKVQKRAPDRQAFLAEMAMCNQAALQQYPELFQDTEEARIAATFLQSAPWIRQFPHFVLVLGDVVTGLKNRLAKNQGGQAQAGGQPAMSAAAAAILGAPRVRPAPGVARRAGPDIGSGPRTESGGADVQKAREEFEKSGFSDEGLENFIGAKLKNRFQGRGAKEPTLA